MWMTLYAKSLCCLQLSKGGVALSLSYTHTHTQKRGREREREREKRNSMSSKRLKVSIICNLNMFDAGKGLTSQPIFDPPFATGVLSNPKLCSRLAFGFSKSGIFFLFCPDISKLGTCFYPGSILLSKSDFSWKRCCCAVWYICFAHTHSLMETLKPRTRNSWDVNKHSEIQNRKERSTSHWFQLLLIWHVLIAKMRARCQ